MHRNSLVPEFQKVLTTGHLKTLFVNEEKKLERLRSFLFITANNNEVPVPEPKTQEFFGYKMAYDIFNDATWRRASDIVFTPAGQQYNLLYYIDGTGVKQPSISQERMGYFANFAKELAGLDTQEKRKPQKGKFRIHTDDSDIEWEITTSGSTAGEQLKAKYLNQERITRLENLNLPSNQTAELNELSKAEQGVFIISGPPLNGVTTTFYAMLRSKDAFLNSINTLEKQPFAELPNITQTVFKLSDTGTSSYAERLQSIIRMDIDVVGVADCHDSQTAVTAAKAADDGKLVYLILREKNVVGALAKWFSLVQDKDLALRNLIGISSQRLVRKLCKDCKQGYEPNKDVLRKFNIAAEKSRLMYREGKVRYTRHGREYTCDTCQGTGFVGRVPIMEMVILNDELRGGLKQSGSMSDISDTLRKSKMLYLQDQALTRVLDGTTSINEMVRVLSRPKRQKSKKTAQK